MLYLIRGLPGSGKTTLARMLNMQLVDAFHVEADSYFTDNEGNYNWDSALIGEAHEWCFNQFRENIFERDVIVSNTFTTQKECDRYFSYCVPNGIPIQVYECKGYFGSVHNVPEATVKKMGQRWENIYVPQVIPLSHHTNYARSRAGSTSERTGS